MKAENPVSIEISPLYDPNGKLMTSCFQMLIISRLFNWVCPETQRSGNRSNRSSTAEVTDGPAETTKTAISGAPTRALNAEARFSK